MSRSSNRTRESGSSLPLNAVDFLVLAVLSDGECHGYGIVQEITARTDGKIKLRPGNLYRVLDRLMERGFVEPKTRKRAGNGSRQYYGITQAGRRVTLEHIDVFLQVVARSKKLTRAARLA